MLSIYSLGSLRTKHKLQSLGSASRHASCICASTSHTFPFLDCVLLTQVQTDKKATLRPSGARAYDCKRHHSSSVTCSGRMHKKVGLRCIVRLQLRAFLGLSAFSVLDRNDIRFAVFCECIEFSATIARCLLSTV